MVFLVHFVCPCVYVKDRGEHRKSEENNRFKVKRLWFPFLCLQIPIPPSSSGSLWMFRLSLWDVIRLEQGIWPPEYPAERFLIHNDLVLYLTHIHTHTKMPVNAYKYLPRCEFLLREELLCAAISISSQNTLIILPGSLVLPLTFSFLDLSFTQIHTRTHTHTRCTLFSQCTVFSQFDLNNMHFYYNI